MPVIILSLVSFVHRDAMLFNRECRAFSYSELSFFFHRGRLSLTLKVRVKLRNFADLDFDLDPTWGITPKIETLYYLPCLPDTKNQERVAIFTKSL